MQMLPTVSSASVTLVAQEYASTPAHRGEVALALDKAQYDLGQEPCLDAAALTEFVHSPNLPNDLGGRAGQTSRSTPVFAASRAINYSVVPTAPGTQPLRQPPARLRRWLSRSRTGIDYHGFRS